MPSHRYIHRWCYPRVAVALVPPCFHFPVGLHGFGKTFALVKTVAARGQPFVKILQGPVEFQKAQAGFRPFIQPLLQQVAFFVKGVRGLLHFRGKVFQSFLLPKLCPFHAPGQAGLLVFRLQQFLFQLRIPFFNFTHQARQACWFSGCSSFCFSFGSRFSISAVKGTITSRRRMPLSLASEMEGR